MEIGIGGSTHDGQGQWHLQLTVAWSEVGRAVEGDFEFGVIKTSKTV